MKILSRESLIRLLEAAGAPHNTAVLWEHGVRMAMEEAAIVTPLRTMHFLSQVGHETDGFRTMVEYASGRAYEGRRDLGNVVAGDGPRFKGRGLIQLTGRHNYTEFQRWLESIGQPTPSVVERPELVAEMPWAALAAAWYWRSRQLNALADSGDDLAAVERVTRRINGGLNGLSDRVARFLRVGAEARRLPEFVALDVPWHRAEDEKKVAEETVIEDTEVGPTPEEPPKEAQVPAHTPIPTDMRPCPRVICFLRRLLRRPCSRCSKR